MDIYKPNIWVKWLKICYVHVDWNSQAVRDSKFYSIEFTHSNSFQTTIDMTLFKALYE